MKNRMRLKYLKSNDLCPLPPANEYSKLTLIQLFEKDPEYFYWMVQNCRYFRISEDLKIKLNKYKKTLSTKIKRELTNSKFI